MCNAIAYYFNQYISTLILLILVLYNYYRIVHLQCIYRVYITYISYNIIIVYGIILITIINYFKHALGIIHYT